MKTQALHISHNFLTTNLPVSHSRGIVMAHFTTVKMQGKHFSLKTTQSCGCHDPALNVL